MGNPNQRISDIERAKAMVLLEEHVRSERISPIDFQARTDQVMGSVTFEDLDRVFFDLPESRRGSTCLWLHEPKQPPSLVAQPVMVQVPDPWDRPIGSGMMTLRKVRRIGWIAAIGMMIGNAVVLEPFLPGSVMPFLILLPLALMALFQTYIRPPKVRYRWKQS